MVIGLGVLVPVNEQVWLDSLEGYFLRCPYEIPYRGSRGLVNRQKEPLKVAET